MVWRSWEPSLLIWRWRKGETRAGLSLIPSLLPIWEAMKHWPYPPLLHHCAGHWTKGLCWLRVWRNIVHGIREEDTDVSGYVTAKAVDQPASQVVQLMVWVPTSSRWLQLSNIGACGESFHKNHNTDTHPSFRAHGFRLRQERPIPLLFVARTLAHHTGKVSEFHLLAVFFKGEDRMLLTDWSDDDHEADDCSWLRSDPLRGNSPLLPTKDVYHALQNMVPFT